jgi:hypothetical protein
MHRYEKNNKLRLKIPIKPNTKHLMLEINEINVVNNDKK